MRSMREMKREWLFSTWDSHKEIIRFKNQAKGNTFSKQGMVKLCNLLSVVDAKCLNGFKRDYTNACRILPLVAIKTRNNRSLDATGCFRSPWADDCQKLGGWNRMTVLSVLRSFPKEPWRQDPRARGLLGLFGTVTLQRSFKAVETRSLLAPPVRGTSRVNHSFSQPRSSSFSWLHWLPGQRRGRGESKKARAIRVMRNMALFMSHLKTILCLLKIFL